MNLSWKDSENGNIPFFVDGASRETPQHIQIRRKGRRDGKYRWLHTLEGTGRLILNGSVHLIERGTGFLMDDSACEYYSVSNDKMWSTYWVRFNGSSMDDFLATSKLKPCSVLFFEDIERLDNLVVKILTMFYSNDPDRVMKCSSYLYDLLTEISINGKSIPQNKIQKSDKKMHTVITYLQKNIFNLVSLDDMANVAGVSPQYFDSKLSERSRKLIV